MDRRSFLRGTVAAFTTVATVVPMRADTGRLRLAELRGSLPPPDPAVAAADDDQSAALQKAMDRAARDGRPLALPPGRYRVSNLRLPDRLSLVGVPGETRLVYGGGGILAEGLGCRSLSLEGIVFDGANRSLSEDGDGLVRFAEVANLSLERVDVLGSAGHGLTLTASGGRMSACRITGARGVGLVAVDGTGLSVADCLVADCGDGGIRVRRGTTGEDGTLLARNRVERIRALSGDGHGDGIAVVDADGVAVSGNRIVGCAGSAVRTAAAGRIRIDGNQALDIAGPAIAVAAAAAGALIDGNAVDGAAAGIVIGGTSGGALSAVNGNMLRNLAGRTADPALAGIGIAADTGATLTGNAVDGAEAIGLRIGWGPALDNVVASANIVRRSGIGIGVSVADGAGGAVIAANMVSANRRGAICGMRWGEIAVADLTAGGAARHGLVLERNVVG